ncbi:glycoside hydrolase family 16 protein, partial [Amanita muscaria]
PSRFSATPSEASVALAPEKTQTVNMSSYSAPSFPPYLWDKDPDIDDLLHDPRRDSLFDGWTPFSARGWVNMGMILVLICSLVALFLGYPITNYIISGRPLIVGYNLGGINGSGQVPDLPGLPRLIDVDTPQSAYSRSGNDGKAYDLVFSDEFNVDGRTFYPGDDPFWEAVDLHYWPTADLEWYDPGTITTKDGKLVITLSEVQNHNLNFMSGMLQSWNKICFTTGYIEVNLSLPGSGQVPGLWPGVWTLGNLGRAGYGASTEGMWPYSYDSCDVGTFPNQTSKDGTPAAAATGGWNGESISFLPGQRLSACTCPGSDHPGPTVTTGRGVPEIDVLEAQVDLGAFQGQASQSFQVAPYNAQYQFLNTTPATTIYDSSQTEFNSYKGGQYQQAISALTYVDSQNYNNTAYETYGFEWWSDPSNRQSGFVTWYANGKPTWTATSATVGPDSVTQVSQRLIPEEAMATLQSIVLNLGLSPGFQKADFKNLVFPSKMHIDYIRVYQRSGLKGGLTCDPPTRPTANYIQSHLPAYSNPNFTTWAQAGYTFPRNSLYYGC